MIDQLVMYTGAYAITLWNLIFSPLAVFHTASQDRVCPASVTYLFTIAIIYFWFKVRMGTFEEIKDLVSEVRLKAGLEWVNKNTVLIGAMVYIGVVVNLQQLGTAKICNVMAIPLRTQLNTLIYPICPTAILLIIFIEIIILFNSITLWLIIPFVLILNVIYHLCLFNVYRYAFGFPFRLAVAGVFTADAFGDALPTIFCLIIAIIYIFLKTMVDKKLKKPL